MPVTCSHCDRPSPYATLCRHCTDTLRHGLRSVAALWLDLDRNVRTRQTRYHDAQTKTRSTTYDSRVLVSDPFADADGYGSRLAGQVTTILTRWARRLGGDQTDALTAAGFLSGRARAAASRVDAERLLADVLSLETRLRRFVDRPTDRWYAGVCGTAYDDGTSCERELWGDPGADYVPCRDCGQTWPAGRRRELLLEEARDRVATAGAIGQILDTLPSWADYPVDLNGKVRTWVSRGQLEPVGTRVVDGDERRLYRVGDVMNLLEASRRRRRPA